MPGFRHIAIAGATGGGGAGTGAFTLAALKEKQKEGRIDSIRVLGRKPETDIKRAEVKAIEDQGIPVHCVDYANEAEVLAALAGVDALISCLAGPAIPDLELALFKTAKKAGVKRVLPSQFTSDLDVLGKDVNPYHALKVIVTDKLRTDPAYEGLEYTLVVTGIFLDAVFGGFSGWYVNRTPSADKPDEVFIAPPFDNKITGCAREDIGKFVAEIVADPDTERTKNVAVRCISDEWTQEEAIKKWEAAAGRYPARATTRLLHKLTVILLCLINRTKTDSPPPHPRASRRTPQACRQIRQRRAQQFLSELGRWVLLGPEALEWIGLVCELSEAEGVGRDAQDVLWWGQVRWEEVEGDKNMILARVNITRGLSVLRMSDIVPYSSLLPPLRCLFSSAYP